MLYCIIIKNQDSEARIMQITLRRWRIEDAPDVARYANNEKIARNLRDVFPYPYSLCDARDVYCGLYRCGRCGSALPRH